MSSADGAPGAAGRRRGLKNARLKAHSRGLRGPRCGRQHPARRLREEELWQPAFSVRCARLAHALVRSKASSAVSSLRPCSSPSPATRRARKRRSRPGSRSPSHSAASTTRRRCASRPTGASSWPRRAAVIKVFDNLADTTPTTFADLRTNVYNFWDRGLLGLALDPGFPAQPYVYVLYAYDHELGSSAPAPRWGTPGALLGSVPDPTGADRRRLRRERPALPPAGAGNVMAGSEQVLIEDWCQQYPSHSVGIAGVRCRRCALRERRRRRELQLRRLGPGRQPAQPVRRSPRWRRGCPDAHLLPRAVRCESGPPHERRPRSASPGRSFGSTRRQVRASPTTRRVEQDRERAPHHRVRTAKSLPPQRAPRD